MLEDFCVIIIIFFFSLLRGQVPSGNTVAPVVYIVPDFSSTGWNLRQSIELLKSFDVTEVA